MAIGRATHDQDQRQHGRLARLVAAPTKKSRSCKWAERWGADTVMDLSTGGDLDACRDAIIDNSTVPIGTVPIYSMIIGRKIEDLDRRRHPRRRSSTRPSRASTTSRSTPACCASTCRSCSKRLIGIVCRGGSLLAKWMLAHNKQNPMYDASSTRSATSCASTT